MIKILVTMRTSENSTYFEHRDAIAHDWVNFLAQYGVLPIFVPNNIVDPAIYIDTVSPAGLLLTGGDSLGEVGKPTERDRTERSLLVAAIQVNLPVFGVCRGLQIINSFFDGALSRELNINHVANDHYVTIDTEYLSDFDDTRVVVNSFHDHGVKIEQLASTLRSFAVSDDSIVEGLIHPDLPIIAVQWHPERNSPVSEIDHKLFSRWLKSCA